MILVGRSLSKSYGQLRALDDVSIACAPGRVYGLLGANGAGKTTLFRILLGLVKPDRGSVEVHSRRIKPLGGIIEKPAAYDYLSAHQNLRLFSSIQAAPTDQDTINDLLVAVGLSPDRKDPVRNYSMGMKQRLGIAIALLNDPECLVLDEPFSGLDPIGIVALRSLIQELATRRGLAVLISSHIIDELARVCEELIVLKEGRIIRNGLIAAIMADCTQSYMITGPEIGHARLWEQYIVDLLPDSVKVYVGPDKIGQVITRLSAEGVGITSCTPEVSMEVLFDQPN